MPDMSDLISSTRNLVQFIYRKIKEVLLLNLHPNVSFHLKTVLTYQIIKCSAHKAAQHQQSTRTRRCLMTDEQTGRQEDETDEDFSTCPNKYCPQWVNQSFQSANKLSLRQEPGRGPPEHCSSAFATPQPRPTPDGERRPHLSHPVGLQSP